MSRLRKEQEVHVSIRRSTHRRVPATEPATFWVSAAGSAIGTDVIVVTVDYTDWTLLLFWDVTVFKRGEWFLCSLLLHHGCVKPRLVCFITHQGGQVTCKPWRAAVGQVKAANSLKTHKYTHWLHIFPPVIQTKMLILITACVQACLTFGYGQQAYPCSVLQQVVESEQVFPSGHVMEQDAIPHTNKHRLTLNIWRS